MLGVHNDNAPSNIIEFFLDSQTTISILLAQKSQNSLALSYQGLKFREAYLPVSVKIWNEIPT